MKLLSAAEMGDLLSPYYPDLDDRILGQLDVYLDLLLRWNAKTNLTAIREPHQIVRRHFGESLFLAQHVPDQAQTLLDLGSGAGFPGIPIQLARPALVVTLAESQQKKASFLREVVRELRLTTQVWARRAEDLPTTARFDVVALRAVDNPEDALRLAEALLAAEGTLAHLTVNAEKQSGLNLWSVRDGNRFLTLP
jgi:16S rRNA (guanine527-N7)-methyltransferase